MKKNCIKVLKNYGFLLALLLGMQMLSSCIDENYDLDNIDTTVQVGVKDLVIPINFDAITLDKVMDFEDNGQVKTIIDPATGEPMYAVYQEGTFSSRSIDVPAFDIGRSTISPMTAELDVVKLKEVLTDDVWDSLSDTLLYAYYPMIENSTRFDVSSVSVDNSIRDVDYLVVDGELKATFKFSSLVAIDNLTLADVKIQLPKGLKVELSCDGEYDPATGILDLSNNGKGIVIKDNKYEMSIHIVGIDFKTAGAEIVTKDKSPGTFVFKTEIKILSGRALVSKTNFLPGMKFSDLPNQIKFKLQPEMSEIIVKEFSGKIRYDIDGVSISSISLNSFPDIISGNGTNIYINNPQVYININNPLASDGIYAEAGVEVIPMKDGVERKPITLDDEVFRLVDAENTFCFSPEKPKTYVEGYESAKWMGFKELSSILSGDGVPDKVRVSVKNPRAPEQHVDNFKLGKKIDKVEGKYLFYAPLDMNENSLIVYESIEDGWSDDDGVDGLVISKLKISAKVSSDIPLGATLTIKALGKNGQAIPGVRFNSAKLEANKKDQQFVFEQESGVITGLDGIAIYATIVSDGSKAFGPKQKLDIKDFKVTVTGHYTNEF